jgi:hypothetical protein
VVDLRLTITHHQSPLLWKVYAEGEAPVGQRPASQRTLSRPLARDTCAVSTIRSRGVRWSHFNRHSRRPSDNYRDRDFQSVPNGHRHANGNGDFHTRANTSAQADPDINEASAHRDRNEASANTYLYACSSNHRRLNLGIRV